MIRYVKTLAFAVAGFAVLAVCYAATDPPKKVSSQPSAQRHSSAFRGKSHKVVQQKYPQVRSVGLDIVNNQNSPTQTPGVIGQGFLPLQLNIHDIGTQVGDRRLKVFVAIYLRPDPKSLDLGPLVCTYISPDAMITPAGENQTSEFSLDIPLQRGDYLYHVFVCDPDLPYKNNLPPEVRLPAPEKFPGLPLRIKLFSAHIN